MDERLLETLQEFFRERPAVDAAYLFGSAGRGEAGPLSDIDVGILLGAEDEPAAIAVDLGTRIAAAGGPAVPIDIVDLARATPLLVHRAVMKGRLLFSRDESRRVAFEVGAIRAYVDTAPLRRLFEEAQRTRIREGRFGTPA